MGVFHSTDEGVACRACGATRALGHRNRFNVCHNCWRRYCNAIGRFGAGKFGDILPDDGTFARDTDDAFNAWLAEELIRALGRLKRTGVAGRCEAYSASKQTASRAQCGKPATQMRGCRCVCVLHSKARAETVEFIEPAATDHYDMVRGMLRDLSNADPKFRAAVQGAIT